MDLHPQTADAIRHLRRLIAQHPENRWAKRSLSLIEHELRGTAPGEFPQPTTNLATIIPRAVDDGEEGDPVLSDDEPIGDAIDDIDWSWLENVKNTAPDLIACPTAIPLEGQ